MKEKVKDLWVEALRSGKYKQGKHSLKNNNDKYCCLGVLCDVYAKTQKKKGFFKNEFGNFVFPNAKDDYVIGVLPTKVIKWAELNNDNPRVKVNGTSLVQLNDSENRTFIEIADVIEQNYKNL